MNCVASSVACSYQLPLISWGWVRDIWGWPWTPSGGEVWEWSLPLCRDSGERQAWMDRVCECMCVCGCGWGWGIGLVLLSGCQPQLQVAVVITSPQHPLNIGNTHANSGDYTPYTRTSWQYLMPRLNSTLERVLMIVTQSKLTGQLNRIDNRFLLDTRMSPVNCYVCIECLALCHSRHNKLLVTLSSNIPQ